MKFYSLISVMVFSFALTACHWGLYSATAEVPVIVISGTSSESLDFETCSSPVLDALRSDDTLLPVIHKLNLKSIWAQRFKSGLSGWSDREALNHLQSILFLEADFKTEGIKITASSEVPQEAADIANAVADSYKAMCDGRASQRYERAMDSLRAQIVAQQKVVDDKRGATVDGDPNHAFAVNEAKRILVQQQSLLDALNVRLKQLIVDQPLMESPLPIISRAVAPAE